MSIDHTSGPEKLIYMANQIGRFFVSENKDTAPAKIADHLTKFWDPRMRQAILAHLDQGGVGLDPAVREALASLRPPVRPPGTRDRGQNLHSNLRVLAGPQRASFTTGEG